MQAGVVPQEIMLMNDTIEKNIVLGRTFDLKLLRDAAAKASILEKIDAMPMGFNSLLGESGLKFSGGERQRVAIARALYGNPSFLLLDEASSALDDETEQEIMDHLRLVSSQVTIIAITHRQSIIRPADQVIEIKKCCP